ncbi:hypothetical protein GCM10023083_29350 [Streptomyces phyllanthi]
MAVVIDEYGATAGVVTVEDIVGEVRDEHDREEQPELVLTGLSPDGRTGWDVDGGVRLDQLTHVIGLTAPDGPYETVAGLIATRLERIPVEGDTVHIDGWELTVLGIDHHRADRVRITAPPPVADERGRRPMTTIQLADRRAHPADQPSSSVPSERSGPAPYCGAWNTSPRCWPPPSSASPSRRCAFAGLVGALTWGD